MNFEILDKNDARAAAEMDALAFAEDIVRSANLVDPVTESARERVLAFCAEHRGSAWEEAPHQPSGEPNALYRQCLAGHLTGSAFVVDDSGQRTLLLHHAKLDRWLQPGGHADGDGNLAAVALKEAAEETGIDGLRVVTPAIDIDIHTIPARPGEPEHVHLDVRFLVLAPAGAVAINNEESHAVRWATADDQAIASSQELRRGVTRALAVASELLQQS